MREDIDTVQSDPNVQNTQPQAYSWHATQGTCKSPQRRISRALKLTQHLRVLSASLLISLEGLPIRAHRGVLDRPGSRSGQSFRLSWQSEGLWTAARPAPTPRPMRHPRGKLLPVE